MANKPNPMDKIKGLSNLDQGQLKVAESLGLISSDAKEPGDNTKPDGPKGDQENGSTSVHKNGTGSVSESTSNNASKAAGDSAGNSGSVNGSVDGSKSGNKRKRRESGQKTGNNPGTTSETETGSVPGSATDTGIDTGTTSDTGSESANGSGSNSAGESTDITAGVIADEVGTNSGSENGSVEEGDDELDRMMAALAADRVPTFEETHTKRAYWIKNDVLKKLDRIATKHGEKNRLINRGLELALLELLKERTGK